MWPGFAVQAGHCPRQEQQANHEQSRTNNNNPKRT